MDTWSVSRNCVETHLSNLGSIGSSYRISAGVNPNLFLLLCLSLLSLCSSPLLRHHGRTTETAKNPVTCTAVSSDLTAAILSPLTFEKPWHDILAELLRIADAEGFTRGRPPDHLGILSLEDLEKAQGEGLAGPTLAEPLFLLLRGRRLTTASSLYLRPREA